MNHNVLPVAEKEDLFYPPVFLIILRPDSSVGRAED